MVTLPTGTFDGVFVKICGITSVEDARAAVSAGADAVGMILAPSPRQVDVATATRIADSVRGEALVVGVFRDHLAAEVIDTAAEIGLDAVQLHGHETTLTSRTVHAAVPILIRACSIEDPSSTDLAGHGADVVMLDSPLPGSGQPFDWTLVGDLTRRFRILLAGGLRPGNVAEAIRIVRPWGVDVGSGVESEPGRKDHDKISAFVAEARAAFAAHPTSSPPLDLRNHA